MDGPLNPPPVPVGTFRSFGPLGPKYVVGQPTHALDDGDWMVSITVLDTGEQVEYRRTHLLADPLAT
jgi:hypothetical protein